ncbi:MAG: dihydroorotate dehydrogenase electron transfer subunit, partial [bacterium]|nr:dihydroorotate dehydrogenase electron transfer subunit [bacterium]
FVGGRTKDDLLALDRFAALGVDVRTATNDGSAGAKGFVTEPLDAELAALRQTGTPFELFTCGPDGLLKAVAQRALDAGRPGWISMDRHMVCGVGACFACIQPVRLPNGEVSNARCCVNGPVFKAEEIVWSI